MLDLVLVVFVFFFVVVVGFFYSDISDIYIYIANNASVKKKRYHTRKSLCLDFVFGGTIVAEKRVDHVLTLLCNGKEKMA